MSADFDGTIVTLVDEEGNEKEFEHIDTLELDNNTYIALVPVLEPGEELLNSDGELVILKVMVDEKGEELLASIEDDDEFERVAEEFERLLEEDYDIQN